MLKTLFITGGAGFIGSAFVRTALKNDYNCIIIDKLTYAGRTENLEDVSQYTNFKFEKVDICDFESIVKLFEQYQPHGIIHFAAESHVDNSISGPKVFIETNILGTFNLLEASRNFVKKYSANNFRFLHVSTDEVFGELGPTGQFNEVTPYHPHSPYSASKAASDHLVRAWHRTYGLNTVITNCSNNYGPRQFPEKLIPKTILNALALKNIPVYGKGENVRDWIHVEDHAQGVLQAFVKGQNGDTYCLGGRSERQNIQVVKTICQMLDQKKPRTDGKSYAELITYVEDRLGHDARYAIDDSYAEEKINFKREYNSFEVGLDKTIDWYLSNEKWIKDIQGC